MFPEFSIEEILFGNAYAYPGLSLVAGDDPAGMLLRMSARLMEQMPKASDLEEFLPNIASHNCLDQNRPLFGVRTRW